MEYNRIKYIYHLALLQKRDVINMLNNICSKDFSLRDLDCVFDYVNKITQTAFEDGFNIGFKVEKEQESRRLGDVLDKD